MNDLPLKPTVVTVAVEFTRSASRTVSFRRLSITATNGVEMYDLVDALQSVRGFSEAFSDWRADRVKEVSELPLGSQKTETFRFVGECEV